MIDLAITPGDGAATTGPIRPRHRARFRPLGRWRHAFEMPCGITGELTLIFKTWRRWRRSPESTDPEFCFVAIGPYVVAYRIMV